MNCINKVQNKCQITNHESIYIYIYKSRDLMRERMRFCHMSHFMKKIEIL